MSQPQTRKGCFSVSKRKFIVKKKKKKNESPFLLIANSFEFQTKWEKKKKRENDDAIQTMKTTNTTLIHHVDTILISFTSEHMLFYQNQPLHLPQMHIHEHERMLSFSLRNLSSVNNVGICISDLNVGPAPSSTCEFNEKVI